MLNARHTVASAMTLTTWLAVAAGCAAGRPVNPSFPLSRAEAHRAQAAMLKSPVRLQRPIVVIGGWKDPGIGSGYVRARLRKLTGDDRVMDVSCGTVFSFADCRRQVIAAVEKAFPGSDPHWTTEVDVVAISMGGLVARYAAAPPEGAPDGAPPLKRLRIARLFTISTPHRGAVMAGAPPLDAVMVDMRPGSPFLSRLDAALGDCGYEIYPYARLDDWIVGAENTSPPGRIAWWVPRPALSGGHLGAFHDVRIITDIARRLRGEQPFTTTPPAPLPGSG